MERRRDDAGRDCIDTDLVLDEFLGETMRDGADEALRSGVERCPGPAAVARGNRSYIDDGSATALFAHVLRGGAGADHGRAHIQVDDLIEQFVGDGFDRRALHQAAGIVDQHIDAAESRHCLVDDLLASCRIGDITTDQQRLAARLFHRRRDFLGLGLALVVMHGDFRAVLPKRDRRRCADARAGACDQDDFIFQIFDHFLPLSNHSATEDTDTLRA